MYREKPEEGRPDSGWRFLAGNEDEEYMNDSNNHHIFAVNTNFVIMIKILFRI